ncbi:MAG: glutathione S-transferase family protein [Methyloprofundus sp.]|nr:glutathione S-transferase family protein [Methyloprofundus sp.]
MIDLYTERTFNGQRVSIMLEETGLDYTAHHINLMQGEQRHADFLKLNPSARIPVLVDHDQGGSSPLVLTQSVAILQYLAEKTQLLIPKTLVERAKMYEWMNFHAIDIGSTLFSAFYLQQLITPHEKQAAEQLRARIHKLYQFFDQQLSEQEFLAGANYSIADITALPAVISQAETLTEYVNLMRWLEQLKLRPAVQQGMSIPSY